MKKTLVSLLSLLALSSLFTLTSCQKETTGNGTQFHATMESRDGKTVLNSTALNWVAGDQVAIYGTAGCGIYSATPQTPATVATLDNVSGTTGDGPFRAFYPSSLPVSNRYGLWYVVLPVTQTYVENSINEFPMYAESSSNQLSFKNLCGVLKLHLTKANTNITTITVHANREINGKFFLANRDGEPVLSFHSSQITQFSDVINGTKAVTLVCEPAQAIDNGKDFYIYLPATFESIEYITFTTTSGQTCTKRVKNGVNIRVERSAVTEITLGENDLVFNSLPEGTLPGFFSIRPDGFFIRFSKGNLQYQASTDTWRFAEHQWDYVGNDTMGTVYENGVKCSNTLISSTYNGWIDLFGWGNNPTFNSTNNSEYNGEECWRDCNISNIAGWHSLSRGEWHYLLYYRANASAKRAFGSVNGVHGLILLPDSWTLPEGCSFTTEANGGNSNNYTQTEWAAMEAAGAVFLPAAGRRWGVNVEHVCDRGNYWTASYSERTYDWCYYLSFGSVSVGIGSYGYKYYGRSLRLGRVFFLS